MKRKGIFLDDERFPSDVKWIKLPNDVEWVIVRNSHEFFVAFEESFPDVVSFDHDIMQFEDGEEITGYTILHEMINRCVEQKLPFPQCEFHSMNPIGVQRMRDFYGFSIKFRDRYGV